MGITVKGLGALKQGAWLTEPCDRGAGALRAKGSAGGARFYFRYRDSAGRYDDLPVGVYDASGRSGLTLAQAKEVAGRLSLRYLGGDRDLRLALDAERRDIASVRAAKARQAEAAAERQAATFAGLLAAYVDHLRSGDKASWRQVRGAIERHVTPRKALSDKPADEIVVDDVMPVFHELLRAGKLREAEKLRAYLRAAYTAARRARTDATMHAFAGFRIRTNPLADLEVSRPKQAADKAAIAARERKWALSERQLAQYWKRLTVERNPRGALLRFHLLTGGQRTEQLARLTAADYDSDQKAITIHDTKGRRKQAHEHVVPLLPEAIRDLEFMRGEAGPYLVTLNKGATPASYDKLWKSMAEIARAMLEAGEVDRLFTPGTIRKTVETRLAAKGVPDEVLARLLSHGLGGVQARSYNAHRYDEEKRSALRKLRALCEPAGKAGNVTAMRRRNNPG